MDIPGHHRLQNLAFPHRPPPLQTLIKPLRTPRPHLTGQGTGAPGRFPNQMCIRDRVKDYLRDAGAVAQVDKYDAAMVPDGIYPADEGGRLADVRLSLIHI